MAVAVVVTPVDSWLVLFAEEQGFIWFFMAFGVWFVKIWWFHGLVFGGVKVEEEKQLGWMVVVRRIPDVVYLICVQNFCLFN
ncbi:hypothetical protein MTR67_031883 [Solanum verrucosum]|uniref:Transmembrane protein n=1 Tax=Solanum verrucosum TaxID=315347 RepID=A0AAF0U3A2_SOLVR|nr:hypothetical protein MTR67_031883 [Solanum verrucosum]